MSDLRVLVMMGSDSDLAVMAEAAKVLTKLEIGHEVVVTSAHRTPERTAEIIKQAPERGVRVFIAGAGAAAHLAGVVAAHTTLPVLVWLQTESADSCAGHGTSGHCGSHDGAEVVWRGTVSSRKLTSDSSLVRDCLRMPPLYL